jgi:hypothetical protein
MGCFGGERHKIRLTVISNSYKEQCVARADRFDGAKWQTLVLLANGEITTSPGLCYRNDRERSAFIADINELAKRVETVLD